MSIEEYNSSLRKPRLMWPIGVALFTPLISGMAAAAFLTDRLAASSSWERPYVFLCMLPTFVTPIFVALMAAEAVDKRIGIKCRCGQSLSCGPHVVRLMREGGACPRCGRIVVEPKSR